MTPTSFEFRLTMPGDSRLVGAVRDLTAHAATYAQLDGAAGRSFAQQVATAIESAIAATGVQNAPIAVQFNANAQAIRGTITWPTNGSTESREVRQPVAS